MQRVFVLDKHKKPLAPCTPARARILLSQHKAVVFKHYPFTIKLKARDKGDTQPLTFKVDQGSKATGIAIVSHNKTHKKVIWACHIEHRGHTISQNLEKRRAIRRSRRSRKTRYRKPKWTNAMSKAHRAHINQKPKGWLAPSIKARLDNTVNLFNKIKTLSPITNIALEDVKFDTQKMQNSMIQGKEYQQGTLFEFEIKEYLLYLHRHTCAYCGGLSKDKILEKEHILCKSKGGTNTITNLSLACRTCNQAKDNLLPKEWLQHLKASKSLINKKRYELFSKVVKGLKPTLRDSSAVNSIRKEIVRQFSHYPLELGSGGLTKYNRTQQGYAKDHWIDAACVGVSGGDIVIPTSLIPLRIKAQGRGSRQMCRVDKYGFPRTKAKQANTTFDFKTGDIVKAIVKKGKKKGVYVGRVAVRNSGFFNITTKDVTIQGISYRNCRLLHKNDGYHYSNLYDKITDNKKQPCHFLPALKNVVSMTLNSED